MKIRNFKKTPTSKTLNESLKKKFGYSLNISKLNLVKSKAMLKTVNESLAAFRSKVGAKATSQKAYMEKKLVAETVQAYVTEMEARIGLERRKANLKRRLSEAQTQEAEVTLAAKDMVDRIQGMIEDLGEMQNEQLQPLADSIRQTLGEETAMAFETSMTDVLATSMEAMRQARQGADAASRVLSGEEGAADAFDDAMVGGDEMGMEDPAMADPEMGMEDPMDTEVTPDMSAGRAPRGGDVELDLSGL